MSRAAAPPSVTIYGLLGLIPFLAPPLALALFPERAAFLARPLAIYGGLILSFLGGARWGLANAAPSPPAGLISLSMLPTLVGLGLLAWPGAGARVQLFGLAVALAAQWLWDVASKGVPPWYPWLRSVLSGGAVVGLIAGALLVPG